MVCLYCGGSTQVTNSRLQKNHNQVWRRRTCIACGSIFTTHERPDLESGLRVQMADGGLLPFHREQLLISIYESCKHRLQPASDATALTDTITARLISHAAQGLLERDAVATVAHDVLARFDQAAATIYTAYHPVAK